MPSSGLDNMKYIKPRDSWLLTTRQLTLQFAIQKSWAGLL